MDWLFACERSGVGRRAFRDRGYDAWSVDLSPSEDDSPYHIIGDALAVIRERRPRNVIAHPECKRLCLSGVLRLYVNGKKSNGIDPKKWIEMLDAARFFRAFFEVHTGRLCVENPIQHGHAKAEHGITITPQTIQPHQFGDDASKATCLWLRGLPPLMASHIDGDFFAATPPQPRRNPAATPPQPRRTAAVFKPDRQRAEQTRAECHAFDPARAHLRRHRSRHG